MGNHALRTVRFRLQGPDNWCNFIPIQSIFFNLPNEPIPHLLLCQLSFRLDISLIKCQFLIVLLVELPFARRTYLGFPQYVRAADRARSRPDHFLPLSGLFDHLSYDFLHWEALCHYSSDLGCDLLRAHVQSLSVPCGGLFNLTHLEQSRGLGIVDRLIPRIQLYDCIKTPQSLPEAPHLCQQDSPGEPYLVIPWVLPEDFLLVLQNPFILGHLLLLGAARSGPFAHKVLCESLVLVWRHLIPRPRFQSNLPFLSIYTFYSMGVLVY